MKKLLALVLALAMALALVACGGSNAGNAGASTPASTPAGDASTPAEGGDAAPAADLKVGCILVGDENEGYTYAHIKGIEEAIAATGVPAENVIMKYSVPEDEK